MRRLMILTLPLILLTSCNTVSSRIICPSDVVYTPAQQKQAADEMIKMPDSSIIKSTFMPNYGDLRKRLDACNNVTK